jgi:diguanylate cyclase (GGDEF)-like protein
MLETSDVSLLDKSENKKYDDLTGLLTKNVIRDFAERKVYESGDKLCCFVMLDIDNFKAVNDTYGHVFGDEVIVRVADIITGIVSKNGVVGRFGGDEFFIVLDNVKDNTEVRSILRSIRMTVAETRFEKNPSATFSCSIGSAIYPINGDTYDIIMKKADKALYIAKEKGRNRYVIYDEQIHGELEEDSELIHKSKNDVAGINSSIYDFSKALNNISDTIYNGKKDAIGATLDYISEICEVDRINIYFGKDLKKIYTAGDTSCSEISYANEDYFKLFNNSGALVLNFTYKLEYVHPMAYRAFKAQNVLTAIHCIIGSKDDVKGIITFENLTYAKMFSQNDILLFLTFTNTIKNILTDTP